MKAIVSEKGQVTIPKELRLRLGITAGQVLDFREECGQLIVVKAKSSEVFHTDSKFFGMIQLDQSVDRTVRDMRDPD